MSARMPMARIARVAALAVAGLTFGIAGCRAVVGIDENALSFPDGGADSSSASRPDGASGENGKDAEAEAGAPGKPEAGPPEGGMPGSGPDGAAPQCINNGDFGACMMCCRQDNMMANGSLEMYLRNDGCICNGAACTTECSTTSCAMPPTGGAPGSCPMCIDNLLMTSACPKAISDCEMDLGCKAMAQCVAGCQ